jgi:hypothetical protein
LSCPSEAHASSAFGLGWGRPLWWSIAASPSRLPTARALVAHGITQGLLELALGVHDPIHR